MAAHTFELTHIKQTHSRAAPNSPAARQVSAMQVRERHKASQVQAAAAADQP